ncbi:MAG: DUF362 domain-containing protein [Planctomycetes bacterium]|nr:DUF362 domain-containing protein [Planctomycetota bacterium]
MANLIKTKILLLAIPFALILAHLAVAEPPAQPYLYRHAIDDPLGLQKSHVYDISDQYVIRGLDVHKPTLIRILNTAVTKLAGIDDPAQAWRKFIYDDDIVALKFNRVGGKKLGTNRHLAEALIENLIDLGYKPERMMIIGLTDLPSNAKNTIPFRYGWQKEETEFATSSVHLAAWLDQVTAIINIPSVMDDNIFSLRASLANLAWPLIKSPAKLYLSQGDPFIPEIYELPQIRGKVRLHIANALRVLYQGGPRVHPQYVYEYSSLLFSTDPVALDRVLLERLKELRHTQPMPHNVPDHLTAEYLITAQAMSLGYYDLNNIQYQKLNPYKKGFFAPPVPQSPQP